MTQSNTLSLKFDDNAWEDYLFWQKADRQTLKRINELIKSARRTPFEGIGKPEALKADLAGFWSRRIDREHRLVYTVEDDTLVIAACRYHYQ
ncbi:Txe/YoeB family addiction module toxin [Marinobacterium sp. D7]|uniref:Txe/YoeB family addiction module toxin n=1 Tax=Marinobacterium ramblicola TaxID=2849041 RepID=UPI001C2DC611|nr:Txe/YoeB family addiction module toxin [Marinobacterium ramblicola]MBV1790209.1 Txe/YoeB family addiction module toxin [Marinobacterium ramblicola]